MTKEDVIDELEAEQKFHKERIFELEEGLREVLQWLKLKAKLHGADSYVLSNKVIPILEKALDE